MRQSWDLCQTNGPTYRFVVPFPSGHRVSGGARRLSVFFPVLPGLPPEHREQLLGFCGPSDYSFRCIGQSRAAAGEWLTWFSVRE